MSFLNYINLELKDKMEESVSLEALFSLQELHTTQPSQVLELELILVISSALSLAQLLSNHIHLK